MYCRYASATSNRKHMYSGQKTFDRKSERSAIADHWDNVDFESFLYVAPICI